MPWWFWFLVWAVLLLGSLASAAIAGYWLFRKGLRLVREAGESFSRLIPGPAPDGGAAADDALGAGADSSPRGVRMPTVAAAVFADPDVVARAYADGKAARREARRQRRVERRAGRGQPQSLSDAELI